MKTLTVAALFISQYPVFFQAKDSKHNVKTHKIGLTTVQVVEDTAPFFYNCLELINKLNFSEFFRCFVRIIWLCCVCFHSEIININGFSS